MFGLFITLVLGWAAGHYVEYLAGIPDPTTGKLPMVWVWTEKALSYWGLWWLVPQFIPYVPVLFKTLAIGASLDGMLDWTEQMYDKWISSFLEVPSGLVGPPMPVTN